MKSLLLRGLLGLLTGTAPGVAASAQVVQSGTGNTGNLLNYPSGTRVYQGGAIATPSGAVILPNVTMPGANGSNTYYYPDGSRITTNSKTVSPAGTFLTPNSPNGGLRNPTVRPTQPSPVSGIRSANQR